MTASELKALLTGLAPTLRKLSDRIEALEQRKCARYRGVHQAALDYVAGDLVTKHGTLYYCTAPTTTTPGSSPAWQLMVKTS